MLTRDTLCNVFDSKVEPRTIDSHIRSLRKKIGIDLIRTAHGIGYAFEPIINTPKAIQEFKRVS